MRSGGIFDVDQARERVAALDEQSAVPSFWDDPAKAQAVLKERNELVERVDTWTTPNTALEDAVLLMDMAEEESDDSLEAELRRSLDDVRAQVEALEFQRMLGTVEDKTGAIVAINSGAGGIESQDWAAMLLRMYLRWCDSHGYKTVMLDELEGDEAGIKSATFSVEGNYAYGHLKAEAGVHRLVRISPFDANARRHTSFASVFVYPDIEDEIEIEVNEADLRVDTYRASGAGGQHVNKTDSAVRLTHLPTGIVVACQNERSQHKNRSTAMKILKARLYEREIQEREKERDAVEAAKRQIDFGSQIRSYVLQPYRLVKDHRTGFEMGNADGVLDGDLDGFIKAYLLSASE
ncbi:MAG: peptide chain release factor 2 [Myxococcales bacterium]